MVIQHPARADSYLCVPPWLFAFAAQGEDVWNGQGGAIVNYFGNVTIAGSTTFVNNTADQVGGYPTFRSARADSYVCSLGCLHLPHRAKTSSTT